jgi:Polyketide synthase dehydratase
MEEVGYALGPAFQKHLEAESLSGTRISRSIVSLTEPQSTYAQSIYQMHPTCVDGILQACAPALWNGNRTNINAVLIPAIIDDVLICSQPKSTTTGLAVVSSSYTGLGDVRDTKNYTADVNVYDLDTCLLLFQLSKLRTKILDTHEMSHMDPTFCCLTWKPDITLTSQTAISASVNLSSGLEDGGWAAVNEAIDLIAYKTPNLKVFEGVVIPDDSTSVWLDKPLKAPGVRSACELFKFGSVDAKTLLSAQEKYGTHSSAEFGVFDITNTSLGKHLAGTKFDLVIARVVSFAIT